ncbi:MAG: SMC-Scp complex subunit ScpB, partial [Hyphomonadaceae bacterium]
MAKLAKQRKQKPAPASRPHPEEPQSGVSKDEEGLTDVPPQATLPDPERLADALRRAEAILFASNEPIDATTLTEALPQGVEAGDVLLKLKAAYATRGVQLVELAGKW